MDPAVGRVITGLGARKAMVKKKQKGFTLIEFLVATMVSMLLVGGGMVYLNRFDARSKLEETKEELISVLKWARNLAKTRQSTSSNALVYVRVTIDSGGMVIAEPVTNVGVGASFLAKDVAPKGVSTTVGSVWFSTYEAKPVKDGGGGKTVPLGANEEVVVSISSLQGIGDTMIVRINASGLINGK